MSGWLASLVQRGKERWNGFRTPSLFWLAALAVVVLGFFLWLKWHDASVRQSYKLAQMKQQTATEVKTLQAQAEAALREANQQHAQAIKDLEMREKRLSDEAQSLKERLAVLQKQQKTAMDQVDSLSTPELVARLARSLDVQGQDLTLRRAASGTGGSPGDTSSQSKESTAGNDSEATVAMSHDALRKMNETFVKLDSCQQQVGIMDQQAKNCSQRVAAEEAVVRQQTTSIDKLNQAVGDKDQILAHREAEYQAELKAARGTRMGRLVRALKAIAVGVAIGVVLR